MFGICLSAILFVADVCQEDGFGVWPTVGSAISLVKCKAVIAIKGVKLVSNSYPLECEIFEDYFSGIVFNLILYRFINALLTVFILCR